VHLCTLIVMKERTYFVYCADSLDRWDWYFDHRLFFTIHFVREELRHLILHCSVGAIVCDFGFLCGRGNSIEWHYVYSRSGYRMEKYDHCKVAVMESIMYSTLTHNTYPDLVPTLFHRITWLLIIIARQMIYDTIVKAIRVK
jgi:hypothetical protein